MDGVSTPLVSPPCGHGALLKVGPRSRPQNLLGREDASTLRTGVSRLTFQPPDRRSPERRYRPVTVTLPLRMSNADTGGKDVRRTLPWRPSSLRPTPIPSDALLTSGPYTPPDPRRATESPIRKPEGNLYYLLGPLRRSGAFLACLRGKSGGHRDPGLWGSPPIPPWGGYRGVRLSPG